MLVYTYDSFTYALLFMPLKYTVEISVKFGCLWFTMGENILNLGIKLGGQNASPGGILLHAYTSITDLYENLRLYYELGVN